MDLGEDSDSLKRMRMRSKHVDDVPLHTYIQNLHTYIHKYSDFLVAMISVVLAQARPNYAGYFSCLKKYI